jgi:sugar (pentulose or hexulose) kinase
VSLDDDGEPTAPAKLWNDTSTVKQCDELTDAFGGRERLISELGNPILPGYTAGIHRRKNPLAEAEQSRSLRPDPARSAPP